jgi:hypothetical protein
MKLPKSRVLQIKNFANQRTWRWSEPPPAFVMHPFHLDRIQGLASHSFGKPEVTMRTRPLIPAALWIALFLLIRGSQLGTTAEDQPPLRRPAPIRNAPPAPNKRAPAPPKEPLPAESSLAKQIDEELRQASAERLAKLGYKQYWEVFTLEELLDKESRIQSAERLRSRGLDISWAKHSAAELLEFEKRIIRAERLLLMGKVVDWKTHTADEMAQMEVDLCHLQARH